MTAPRARLSQVPSGVRLRSAEPQPGNWKTRPAGYRIPSAVSSPSRAGKKMGLSLTSAKGEDGERVYSLKA
jgi:hypothetical protein